MLILTNDDGIDAPGLRALRRAIAEVLPQFAPDLAVVTVAPAQEQSSCGHQVTVARPIAVEKRDRQDETQAEYAVTGTPADCTRLALSHLVPEATWLVAGINAGGNLGADIYVSGTVAAIREAALWGVPAIAISQYIRRPWPVDWDRAATWAARAIAAIWSQNPDWFTGPEPIASDPAGSDLARSDLAGIYQPRSRPIAPFWNVNLPHLEPGGPEPDLIFCPGGLVDPLPVAYELGPEGYRYCGRYRDRPRSEGSDVAVCFGGQIAIVRYDLP